MKYVRIRKDREASDGHMGTSGRGNRGSGCHKSQRKVMEEERHMQGLHQWWP